MPIFSLGERRVALLGEHHYIAHDATLVGSIVLHADVSIWFKVVIRAENDSVTIGAGSNVQIGKGVLIGANTLVPEGIYKRELREE